MYPCADGATPLPGICGRRHILRPANFVDVAQVAIETGLSSKLPPAVRHHRLPPKLLPVRVLGYALNSHLQKIVFSLLLQMNTSTRDGPAAPKGLQHFSGPPKASSSLERPPDVQGLQEQMAPLVSGPYPGNLLQPGARPPSTAPLGGHRKKEQTSKMTP